MTDIEEAYVNNIYNNPVMRDQMHDLLATQCLHISYLEDYADELRKWNPASAAELDALIEQVEMDRFDVADLMGMAY